MKVSDVINKGYHKDLPVYYNHATVIDYNQSQNQFLATKKASLKKYKLSRFHTTTCYKPLSQIFL